MFSLFFITFVYYRRLDGELFAASQSLLNAAFGLLNTLFLLTSSWFVATAVQQARRQVGRAVPAGFLLALGCGLAFSVLKVLEYREKITAGITPASNDFFMYYFVFTAIHFVHVIIGMGVLLYMTRISWGGDRDATTLRNLESGASFWHLVDLLWIVLFALFYLLR
jgi:nitric oxide reductase NorE protein